LRITPLKNLAVVFERRARARARIKENFLEGRHFGGVDRMDEKNEEREGKKITAWPRWIFFVMGTLPTGIKLASFEGTPWTKVWGMMFLSSFIVIEIAVILGQAGDPEFPHPTCDASILGNPNDEKVEPQTTRLKTRLQTIELIMCTIAFLCHISLATWAFSTLWLPALTFLQVSHILDRTKTVILLICMSIFVLTPILVQILHCLGVQELQERIPIWTIWKRAWLVTIVASVLLRENKRKPKSLQRFDNFMKVDAITGLLWFGLFNILCFRILNLICKRCPTVAKALLVVPEPKAVREQVEMPDGTSTEVLERELPPVASDAFMALSFFLSNLGICVLWYAFNYNEAGTVNSARTDMFGRDFE
jgi:hypothetical protein